MRPMWIQEGAASSPVVGRLMVPWSSSRARPAGVWRTEGRALERAVVGRFGGEGLGCRVAVVLVGWVMI